MLGKNFLDLENPDYFEVLYDMNDIDGDDGDNVKLNGIVTAVEPRCYDWPSEDYYH